MATRSKNGGRIRFAASGLVGGMAIAGLTLGAIASTIQQRSSTAPPVQPTGKLGQDLFLAIDHRDLQQVETLLKNGADPNSRNGLEFTPLYIAAASHQPEVMDALLKAGAKPNAESTYGTALIFACETANLDGAMKLIERGSDINTMRTDGSTPLIMASMAGYPPLVAELLKRKADVKVQDDGGETALNIASMRGNTAVVQMLLGAGAKVDSEDVDGMTPLMQAAMAGHADTVQVLLKAGANVNAKDSSGRTALMLAANYGDYPDVVKLLIGADADQNVKDEKGRTAAMLAARHGYGETAGLLGSKPDVPAIDARDAVGRSVKMLEASMQQFTESATCVSCHQEGLGRMATAAAAAKGFAMNPAVEKIQTARVQGMLMGLKPLEQQALKSPEAMKQLPLIEMNEVNTMYSWLIAGMAAKGQPANEATAVMAMCLAKQQSPNGSWTFSLPRIPLQSSLVTFTALAARDIQVYGPRSESKEIDERVAKAREWLMSVKPRNGEDTASRLLGLKWTGADDQARKQAIDEVLAGQQADGGWAQEPGIASDAYATGHALYALNIAGVPVEDAAYQKGVAFLLRTQDDGGSWFVNKRAIPANNYFDGGFPYGESQYASFDATCWATLALLPTLKS